MNKVKLFVSSDGTRVNVDENSLPSLKQILPSFNDITGHIKAQLGKEEFQPIIIEVSQDKLEDINKDIRRKSCSVAGYSKIAIYLESYSSRKVLPIILIIQKQ